MSYRHIEVQLTMWYSERKILISNNIRIPQFQVLIAGNEHSFADHKLIKLRISIHACIANKPDEFTYNYFLLCPFLLLCELKAANPTSTLQVHSSRSFFSRTNTSTIKIPNSPMLKYQREKLQYM